MRILFYYLQKYEGSCLYATYHIQLETEMCETRRRISFRSSVELFTDTCDIFPYKLPAHSLYITEVTFISS